MTTTDAFIGCLIVNGTLGPITDLTIVHTAHNAGSDRPPPITLQALETSFFEATIVEGSSDEWSVSFKANGTSLSGSTRCDIEDVDLQSQGCVILVVYDASIGFSVIPPASSPCLHNSYDGDTAAAAADAAAAAPLSSWSGPLQCLIFNATGGPISDLQVAHTILGNTQSPPVSSLSNGVTLQRSGKQCTIEHEDYQANSCVIVALYNATTGFSIITPVSKPCLNNEYE